MNIKRRVGISRRTALYRVKVPPNSYLMKQQSDLQKKKETVSESSIVPAGNEASSRRTRRASRKRFAENKSFPGIKRGGSRPSNAAKEKTKGQQHRSRKKQRPLTDRSTTRAAIILDQKSKHQHTNPSHREKHAILQKNERTTDRSLSSGRGNSSKNL